MAGLIQSGGFGTFSKRYGLAAAGLIEAEVVTADGAVRIANACTNPDLFWALKGGGGGSSSPGAAVGREARLKEYHVSAVTGGRDALGEVTVLLELKGRLSSGVGVSTDILEASARAYVRALSNAIEGAAIREAEALTAEAATERTPGP